MPGVRALARSLYAHVRDLPIISPHGHTDPAWFAYDEPFGDAVDLLLAPDHYLYRMLYSQGVSLDQLGVRTRQGAPAFEPRAAWRQFASHYKLFRGTPSATLARPGVCGGLRSYGVAWRPKPRISISMPSARRSPPRSGRGALRKFNIEVLATTESPTDTLEAHQVIRRSGWGGRVISTYRPGPGRRSRARVLS
jgi:glucuronate isomerase